MNTDQHAQTFTRWIYTDYELLTITPCEKIQAVFAYPDDENEGKFKLEASPIRFLAIAICTQRFFEKPKDAPEITIGTEYESPFVRREVVGLELAGGSFEICNELDCFAGYCFEGDDISQATSHLSHIKYPLTATTLG